MMTRILPLVSLSLLMGVGQQSEQRSPSPALPAKTVAKSKPVSQRQPRVLHRSSTKTTTVPEFGFVGLPQTDEDDNLYFQIGSPHSIPQFFRLVWSDEGSSKIFGLPVEFTQNDPIDFTITASGQVYVLTMDPKNLYHAFRLEPDGDARETKLDTPKGLWLSALGVFDDDTILVVGHYGSDAPENLRGTQYAALFDSSGKWLSDLRKSLSRRKPIADTVPKYNGYTIRAGADGNLYLLEPNSVLVISASGEVVRRLKFKKPDPEEDATGLSVSGGLLCIELQRVEIGKPVKPKFLMLGASTGKDLGYFAPPDEKAEWIAFTKDAGFIFLEDQGDTVRFFTAAMN